MQMKRKVQLGALAVSLNALFAMTVLTKPAFASSCNPQLVCLCRTLAGCQAVAPPGCTATSATCTQIECGGQMSSTVCQYQ